MSNCNFHGGSNVCHRCGRNPCRCNTGCIAGDTGRAGAIVGSYQSVKDLQASQPVGKPGDHYLVERDVYGFDPNTKSWQYVGSLAGPTGPTGPFLL